MMPKTIQFLALLLIGAVAANVRAQESLVESYLGEARSAIVRADYPRAERLYRVALTEANKLSNQVAKVEGALTALNGLGNSLVSQQKLSDAESVVRTHIELCELADNARSRRCLMARANLSEILQRESKFQEAEEMARRVLSLREESDVPQVDVGYSLVTLAAMFINQRRFEQAEPLLIKAVAIFGLIKGEEASRENVLAGVQAKRLLATCLLERRNYVGAEAQIKTAITVREILEGPNSIEMVEELRIYQRILTETHRTREASAVNARAIRIEKYYARVNQ